MDTFSSPPLRGGTNHWCGWIMASLQAGVALWEDWAMTPGRTRHGRGATGTPPHPPSRRYDPQRSALEEARGTRRQSSQQCRFTSIQVLGEVLGIETLRPVKVGPAASPLFTFFFYRSLVLVRPCFPPALRVARSAALRFVTAVVQSGQLRGRMATACHNH